MNIIRNHLTFKILLFNILVVLPLSLIVYFYLPMRFKTFTIEEKGKILRQLNEQATLYLHDSSDDSSSVESGVNQQDSKIVKVLKENPDYTYVMVFASSADRNPEILDNREEALQALELFEGKMEKTEIKEWEGKLHVISPILGYDEEGKEITSGFLQTGFSLESLMKEVRKTNSIIIGLCVVFIVLGIVSGFIQSLLLVKPLKKTIELIKIVAKGDFTQKLEITSRDELGDLIQALNIMISTWKQSIEKIKGAIDLSNSASYKIAIAAKQQEKITIQEASSINEITTTVEELNNSSKQVSENADVVAEGSKGVLEIAFDGQDSVNKSIEEFSAIRERVNIIAEHILTLSKEAQEIGNIVEEVSSIANKTDMLAINAGIEAARAGEYGKGFSVVASEIRNLADQSQKSAAKISSLIEKIQSSTNATVMATEEGTKGVKEGIKLISETGLTLEAAIANMRETVDSVQEIAISSRQQSLGTEQVAETMVTINDGMKETAVAAKKTLEESEHLQSLNHQLQEMIHSYTI